MTGSNAYFVHMKIGEEMIGMESAGRMRHCPENTRFGQHAEISVCKHVPKIFKLVAQIQNILAIVHVVYNILVRACLNIMRFLSFVQN